VAAVVAFVTVEALDALTIPLRPVKV